MCINAVVVLCCLRTDEQIDALEEFHEYPGSSVNEYPPPISSFESTGSKPIGLKSLIVSTPAFLGICLINATFHF